jgi:hypothetical protein
VRILRIAVVDLFPGSDHFDGHPARRTIPADGPPICFSFDLPYKWVPYPLRCLRRVGLMNLFQGVRAVAPPVEKTPTPSA